MQRTLRIGGQPQPAVITTQGNEPIDRMLRVGDDNKIGEVVDRLYTLKASLKAKNDAHKREIEGMESLIKELTAEVKTYAEEHNKRRISGSSAVAEFSPGISRSIDPVKLLTFLKGLGKTSEFWQFTKVNIGDVTKHYGEVVLESADVLKIETSEFGNMKVVQHRT